MALGPANALCTYLDVLQGGDVAVIPVHMRKAELSHYQSPINLPSSGFPSTSCSDPSLQDSTAPATDPTVNASALCSSASALEQQGIGSNTPPL